MLRVAGLDDIVASKRWANRPKDHEALPELELLAEQATAAQRAPAEAEPESPLTVEDIGRHLSPGGPGPSPGPGGPEPRPPSLGP